MVQDVDGKMFYLTTESVRACNARHSRHRDHLVLILDAPLVLLGMHEVLHFAADFPHM
jgi:uncharacterized protein (DUF952 family)